MNIASPDPRRSVELLVNDQRMTAQITVYDASYRPVASAVGELRTQLPPGVYEVESVVGQKRQSKFVVLNPGNTKQNVYFQNQETGLASAAPLPGTETTHEWHRFPAEEWSRKETMAGVAGASARLFVFIRTLEPEKYKDSYDRGLRLMNEHGKLICDFKDGVVRGPVHGWTALTVNLPPGGYQLYRGGRGRPARYQAVWLSEGWETQVFIPAQEMPQLDKLSCFMARLGSGFHPDNDAYLSSEIVLDGLCRGVNLASSTQMQSLLRGKFENPWLGILALHAMRLDTTTDQSLTQTVLDNLTDLIGGHPDLRALKLRTDTASSEPFTFPPILYASFKLLRAHASEFPGTVKFHTLASQIFEALLHDSAWVAWHKLPPVKREPKAIQSSKQAFFVASGSKWVVPQSTSSRNLNLKISLSDLFANPETPQENPLVADLLELSETYSFENRQGDITYSVDPGPLLIEDKAERISKQLKLPVDKVDRVLNRIRENPELLTQPRKMTVTEMSVAESVLSRRSLKEDPSKRRSAESGPVSLTASIDAVMQTRMSFRRLSDQKIVDTHTLRGWLKQLEVLRGWMEDHQDAVLLVDANTQVVYASPAFVKLADNSLKDLAAQKVSKSSSPVLSTLNELPTDLAEISLQTPSGLQRYRVQCQRFIDEASLRLFATVYRMKPIDRPSLDLSVQREIRRMLSSVTYYASVMKFCNPQERNRYISYIDRDLGKFDSFMSKAIEGDLKND